MPHPRLPLLILTLTTAAASADDAKPTGDPAVLPAGGALEELWNEGSFTEGVAPAPDGTIYFSDIPFDEKTSGRVLRFDPKTGKTTVFCADSGKSNGLMFDFNGRLIAACGAMAGHRALVEFTPDGTAKILADRYDGKRLNSPNDLVIHPKGWIYFSDPRYAGDDPLELDHMSVYRYHPADGTLRRVTTDVEKPNGLILSPDARTLYVAETNNGTTEVRTAPPDLKPGRMTLTTFPVKDDGSLGEKRVLVDFGGQTGIDGMAVDRDGRIYAAVQSKGRLGVRVYSPEGEELAHIPTPDHPTNCAFGTGDESKSLYITAGKGLHRIRLNVEGYEPTAAAK